MTQNPKICLIDDDDIYQFTMSRTLQKKNLSSEIISFANGQLAIDFFKNNVQNQTELPDVIFLDINMPIMDGWQFLEEFNLIKSTLSKPMSVFLVSSSIDENDMLRAKKFPEVQQYIIKPVKPEELDHIFQNLYQ